MKIHKYTLENEYINMPIGCKIIHVDYQNDIITLWCEINDSMTVAKHYFQVVGTGQDVPRNGKHIKTLFDGPFVWHLYRI